MGPTNKGCQIFFFFPKDLNGLPGIEYYQTPCSLSVVVSDLGMLYAYAIRVAHCGGLHNAFTRSIQTSDQARRGVRDEDFSNEDLCKHV